MFIEEKSYYFEMSNNYNECLRGNAKRINQFLSILVSGDRCCYPPSKKLV